MTARPFPSNPDSGATLLTKTRVVFLALTISASLVILASILYFLYHLWLSLLHTTAKTIPFDSSAPLQLHRFSYRDLKTATRDFDASCVIGKGGSGTVFRGVLPSSNNKLIAIKRLDSFSLQTEREFQNELQILGGLRSPFLVTLLGYCAEKSHRLLVYDYMPNKSLQDSLFGDALHSLSWDKRFEVILDVARALEFLHLGCDPPVIHGDIKPSNVLLDSDHRAKISDFGLSRIKLEEPGHDFGVDMFSQDLGKSQELSGNLTAAETTTTTPTPAISTPPAVEVDFSAALQASSSSKHSRTCSHNVKALNLNSTSYNNNADVTIAASEKGKELVSSVDFGGADCDWNRKFVPYDGGEPCSDAKQWGKDWWWRQDGSNELCSKDYVTEWIGSQICPSTNPDWDDEKKASDGPAKSEAEHPSPAMESNFPGLEEEKESSRGRKKGKKKKKKARKMQEWWREEHLAEMSKKKKKKKSNKNRLKGLEIKLLKGLSRRFYLGGRGKRFDENERNEGEDNGEFSFRRGWRKSRNNHNNSGGSEDLFSRELSSTTSMRGTLCYVAPEYGGCGYLMEKADIYSLGVLILVIVSGRRPLHVLASPMKLEKANLISWCRQLAHSGNVLEAVDERLKEEYDREQASLCINLALSCLQKMPEMRPDVGDIVRILRGEMHLPAMPFEFSPSPPSKLYSRSRRKHKLTPE